MAELAEAQPSIEERISALSAVPEQAPEDTGGNPADVDGGAPDLVDADQTQAADGSVAEGEPGGEASESEAEASEDDVEELEIGDIAGLAEHIGVDPADLYDNIAVPYTINGEREELTLGQIKDRLQDYHEAIAVREQAQQTLDRYGQAEQQLNQALEANTQQFQSMMQAMQQTMLADMQNINWAELEKTNPGEWARQAEMFRQRQGRMQQIAAQAHQDFQQRQAQLKEQQGAMQDEHLQREQQRLLRAIPEWRDDKVATAERGRLVEYMRDSGFSADEMAAVSDHRALVLARKAMLYDQMQKNGDVAKKKVVKLAKKVVKPGARQTSREQQHDREQQLVSNHRKNPKSIDAAAARIRARI